MCTLDLMRWASFVSEEPELPVAARQAAQEVRRQLAGADPDLLLVFVSAHHEEDYELVPAEVASYFPGATLIGCSGGGVVGGGREVEHSPALSLTAAVLPDIAITAFHVGADESDALVSSHEVWHEIMDVDPEQPVHFIVLPDPFSCDARGLLDSLDQAFPASAKIGGLASGAQQPGDNVLFIDDEAVDEGAVGVVLNGPLDMDTIVAQGCRPVGSAMFVTRAFRNKILEIDGQRPTEAMADLYEQLPLRDQDLFRHSLFLGVVMNPGLDAYGPGDFLVRNIVGVDPETGVLSVGEMVQPGQVVQFHLRDASTSAEDLSSLLQAYKSRTGGVPEGVLLFSCLGRGEVLYGEPDHDCRVIAEHLGGMPIGGFFCNGEIGPVNRRTFLHGYTSSIALFRSRPAGD